MQVMEMSSSQKFLICNFNLSMESHILPLDSLLVIVVMSLVKVGFLCCCEERIPEDPQRRRSGDKSCLWHQMQNQRNSTEFPVSLPP